MKGGREATATLDDLKATLRVRAVTQRDEYGPGGIRRFSMWTCQCLTEQSGLVEVRREQNVVPSQHEEDDKRPPPFPLVLVPGADSDGPCIGDHPPTLQARLSECSALWRHAPPAS